MSGLRRAATALAHFRRARARIPQGALRLPALWLVTDPSRTPDPAAAAARLPRGAGVIYRSFGASDAVMVGRRLRRIADRGGLTLLVGADPALARRVKADGVHLPERLMGRAPALRRAHPRWLITTACHSPAALGRAARLGLDAAVLSTAFESRSPSSKRPLGPVRFAALTRGARLPVIALGGVSETTAPRLIGSGAWGVAAVEALGG